MVGERLVGLARVLDDSELVAFVHYVLVHPEYQGQKIAGNMVEYIRDKYKNYLYIEGMQEDSKNVAFYSSPRPPMPRLYVERSSWLENVLAGCFGDRCR